MGVLGWAPDVFWAATMRELCPAVDGWRLGQGDDPDKAKREAEEARELHALLDEINANLKAKN